MKTAILVAALALRMGPDDSIYHKFFDHKIAALPATHRLRLLVPYVNYLKNSKPKDAADYIENLKSEYGKECKSLGEPFFIFDGGGTCMPSEEKCDRSVGNLSRKVLIPKLRKGDPIALELLTMHSVLVTLDGQESEEAGGYFRAANRKATKAMFSKIKEKHAEFLGKCHVKFDDWVEWLRKQ